MKANIKHGCLRLPGLGSLVSLRGSPGAQWLYSRDEHIDLDSLEISESKRGISAVLGTLLLATHLTNIAA